jgi:2-polyprenyl-3-methyl-5-hydroxy-6-metoxy-1,4-benzoquinol methylase
MDPLSDAKIVDSWKKNAAPWTNAVRADEIESRRLVTNQAIVDAVVSLSPRSALDIGCGEGWLVRVLADRGICSVGVDVVPQLIEQARRAGSGDFRVASYEELAQGALDLTVDVAVANFSLIGKESVEGLLAHAHRLLEPSGSLVIQTLHPLATSTASALPYVDGWRTGSWEGFSAEFTDPAPWYFRTIESWVRLLVRNNWHLREVREPVHPVSKQPASVIFMAQAAG